MTNIKIPASVPASRRNEYHQNYSTLTNNSGKLLLIAGDQKIEHLNTDFFGPGISLEDNNPEHLFKITAASAGGALAAHLGLISSYGHRYRQLPYIVKLNGKTNLGSGEEKDSSQLWWTVDDIVKFKKQSGLKIGGVGYTLYLGGVYEAKILATIAQSIFQAHQAGLVAILWVYPRGKNIKEEDIHTIAGGSGVAASLGADFVKVKYPYGLKDKKKAAENFREVTAAAGLTKVICVGSGKMPAKELLEQLERQIKISGSNGLAIGRNLHQRPLEEASRLAAALGAIIWKGATIKEANLIYNKKQIVKSGGSRFLGIF